MKNTIISISIGIVLGGIALFGINTLYQDHQNLQQVINFLNAEIQAQQKQQSLSSQTTK